MNGEKLAVVIVTYNRVELLEQCLDKLEKQTYPIDAVVVVDNASTDGTAEFLQNYTRLPLKIHTSQENTGGAGGFYQGVKLAFETGFDWLYIVDDDVFPLPDCIEKLMAIKQKAMISVRENNDGQLVERSALQYDLKNPFVINPKRNSIDSEYPSREEMPETVIVENIPFEGLMIHREVVDKIGLPEPNYFISSDDVDYSLRIRQAGYQIYAVRDAVLTRQLPYNQQEALSTWKGYYMYRNVFHIHYKFGENVWVRNKPYALAMGGIIIALLRGRFSQAKQILRAMLSFKTLLTNR